MITTKKVVTFTALLVPFLLLSSCKTLEVTPGAERVRVFESEPKGCLYVGEVSSVQEEQTVGTLETEMDLATRVDLRNKAHSLGGNILVFLKGKNSNTLPGSAPMAMKTGSKTSVGAEAATQKSENSEKNPDETKKIVFLATVFKCPSSILNQ